MTRRCSHCSNNGHNSRTCPTRGGSGAGVKLFGVRLTDGSSFMKKSASMGNLSLYTNPSSPTGSDPVQDPVGVPDGYLSDDPNHASCSTNRRCERKKGKPWTEKEHRLFLIGLQKLGKGDWRGIARNYVVSRTPTQVASHAQKYFIRHSNASRRKRRSSLFDMVPDTVDEDPQPRPEEQPLPTSSDPQDTENSNSFPSLNLSLSTEAEPMETTSLEPPNEPMEEPMALTSDWPPSIPSFVPTYLPIPYPFWPPAVACHEEDATTRGLNHRVLRPIPVLRKEPVNVDELVGMSHLNLRETEKNHVAPPELSLNLVGAPTRQSAFHASASVADGKNNVIRAL